MVRGKREPPETAGNATAAGLNGSRFCTSAVFAFASFSEEVYAQTRFAEGVARGVKSGAL